MSGHDKTCGCSAESARRAELKQGELDPGSAALAEALRLIFVVLKLVMVGALVLFIYGGLFKVESNEKAIVLRFGKVKGLGTTKAILEPGWHWSWPRPIEERIIIPGDVKEIDDDGFWYYLSEKEKTTKQQSRPGQTLQIVRDGYHLTASAGAAAKQAQGLDYNLMHTYWLIEYEITEPIKYVERFWDGTKENEKSIEGLLKNMLADAVILTSAGYDIDWIMGGKRLEFKGKVLELMRERLAKMQTGIEVKLQLVGQIYPRQLANAFDEVTKAYSEAEKTEKQAKAKRDEILNEAQSDSDILIAQAKAYRHEIVQAAKADAERLEVVLQKITQAVEQKVPDSESGYEAKRKQEFDKLLQVTMDELYQEALREVIAASDETFVMPSKGDVPSEWRVYLNRNATLGQQGAPTK